MRESWRWRYRRRICGFERRGGGKRLVNTGRGRSSGSGARERRYDVRRECSVLVGSGGGAGV